MSEHDEFEVTVDGYFAILPEWVIDADISDRAVRLYAVLRRIAGGSLRGWRSRAKLAERMRCSLSSIDRALKELQDVGAVTIRHRFTNPEFSSFTYERDAEHPIRAANGYVIHNAPKLGGGVTGDGTPVVTGDEEVSSPVTGGMASPVKGGVASPVTHEKEKARTGKARREESGAPSALGTHDDGPRRKRPAVRLPEDWAPTESHHEYCRNTGIDIAIEARNFRLHAEEHDRRAVAWNAAFSRWLMKARPTRPVTSGVSETGRLWQD